MKKTKLYYIRKSRHVTQVQLSKAAGMNQSVLSRYETGILDINRAEAITVYRMAKFLECSIEEILELREEDCDGA